MLLIVVVLLGLAVSAIWAPWWVTAPLAGVVVTYGYLRARSLSNAVSEGIRRSKAGILRGATVQVHQLKQAGTREGVPQYELEVTLTPRPGNSQVRPWEPAALHFVNRPKGTDLVRVQVREGKEYVSAVGRTVKGPQRLKLLAEWPDGTTRLTLEYFQSEIAEVRLERD